MTAANANTSHLKTWLLARSGLSTHWIVTFGVSLTLLSLVFVKFLSGSNASGAFILYAYIHGFLVSYFTHSFFSGETAAMLPRRKSRGRFFCLMEWMLNLVTLSALWGVLSKIDPSQTQVTTLELFQMFTSWVLGWLAFQIFTRMGLWVVFAMLTMMVVPVENPWLIWRVALILSASLMVGVNIGKLVQNTEKPRQSSRFASRRLSKPQTGYLNLLRIKAEFLKKPGASSLFRILLLEAVVTTLLFATGVTVHSMFELFSDNPGEDFTSKRLGFFITLALIRITLKGTFTFTLENGLALLPGMSRDTWCRRNRQFDTIDRLATLLMLLIVPTLTDACFNLINGGGWVISQGFRYYVMCLLAALPIIAVILTMLSSNRNRGVFSGNFVLSLSDRTTNRKQLPWKTMATTYFIGIVLILSLVVLAANYGEILEQISRGSLLSVWLPPYLALLAFLFWLESHWTRRAFQKGDLL